MAITSAPMQAASALLLLLLLLVLLLVHPSPAVSTGAREVEAGRVGNACLGEACLLGDDTAVEMESETSRRLMGMQRRYISYESLRADVVPCTRPGVPYYNCHAPARANAYRRGCGIITRCARYDYP